MNIVIIGGVAAGAKAAAKIKRLLPESNVTIYTEDTNVSYSACGLPYFIEGNFTDYRMLLVRSVEEFTASGIDVHLNAHVSKIIPKHQQVLVSYENYSEIVSYDKLIIATGAKPIIPNIIGVDSFENIYTLRRIEDGINIRNKMLKSKKAVIIGSGYIGLELLEAFVKNGLEVSLIEKNSHIIPMFDSEISDFIKKRLENNENKNFQIYTNELITEIIGENNVASKVRLISGQELETDMIVICTGVEPNIKLAYDAGIEIGETGAIKVNKTMQTSIHNIYACGDCCESYHLITGKNVWYPLGSTANKEGRCAALNAAGIYTKFEGVLGSAVTRCLDTTMSMTGLTERDAIEQGYSPVSVIISKPDMVGYMPEASDIVLKVVADKFSGLILGGQAIGSFGADKRINTLATALIGHMTVQEFRHNDLTYSPPYSTTIDPLLDAMNLLCKKLVHHC